MSGKYIWYISKYAVPTTDSTIGGRGYMVMRELAKRGYQSLILASNSNEMCQTPVMPTFCLKEHVDGIQFWWIRTLQYSGARSL